MIYTLFTFTGMLVWAMIAIVSLLVVYLSASEKPGWAMFWAVTAAVVVFGFSDFRLDLSLTDMALLAGGYIGAGAVYGLVRWVGLVRKIKRAWLTEAAKYSDIKGAPSGSNLEQIQRGLAVQFRSNDYKIELPPKASEFRSRVRTWVWFWPVSLSIWLFEDAIIGAARGIAKVIGEGFDSVTNVAWERDV